MKTSGRTALDKQIPDLSKNHSLGKLHNALRLFVERYIIVMYVPFLSSLLLFAAIVPVPLLSIQIRFRNINSPGTTRSLQRREVLEGSFLEVNSKVSQFEASRMFRLLLTTKWFDSTENLSRD